MAKKDDNSRKINALLPKALIKKHVIKRNIALKLKYYLLIVLFFQSVLLIIVLFFVGFVLKEREELKSERNEKYVYWYGIASNYPGRPDVLFNMAKSAYENGKKEVAIDYLNSALKIDPLFEKAEKFLEEIN